nr:group II intron maturase-specific domain-containing protein [uncultured Marinifilum sp.]
MNSVRYAADAILPEKTKLVYCRYYRRQGDHSIVKFDFLKYSFQPCTTSRRTGKLFLGYDCAISINAKKRIADKMEELDIVGLTYKSIVGVAQFLNPYIRGWINYYGKFRKHEMHSIFQLLRKRIIRWARKRYKRYKTSVNRAFKWFETVRKQFPSLF